MFKIVSNSKVSQIQIKKLGLSIGFIMVKSVEQTVPDRHKGFIDVAFLNNSLFHAVLDTDCTKVNSLIKDVFIFKKKYTKRNLN